MYPSSDAPAVDHSQARTQLNHDSHRHATNARPPLLGARINRHEPSSRIAETCCCQAIQWSEARSAAQAAGLATRCRRRSGRFDSEYGNRWHSATRRKNEGDEKISRELPAISVSGAVPRDRDAHTNETWHGMG